MHINLLSFSPVLQTDLYCSSLLAFDTLGHGYFQNRASLIGASVFVAVASEIDENAISETLWNRRNWIAETCMTGIMNCTILYK
jgi:hypothetical protein